ncbi:MAG: hypothetical protein LBI53_05705 [Candidatus Peribacteria bacterium]|jgi:hypothetical protein|nr:hypothetical protein [Candidatus Peribacteria bacterium]
MTIENKKTLLYTKITDTCDQLPIARYLKNEVKNSLQYFHQYKLQNIQKNLKAFCEYLLFLNKENCIRIMDMPVENESPKSLSNNISYFYHHETISNKEKKLATKKIENNTYEIITYIQGIKGLLLLTIDEFCNASPTRMAINTFIWEKNSTKKKKKG